MAEKKSCFVTIVVNVVGEKPANVYICGNKDSLGNWIPEEAKQMKKTYDGNFILRAKFNIGEVIAFKLLCGPSWRCVDKGIFGEEIENHVVVAESGVVKEVTIYNWATILE